METSYATPKINVPLKRDEPRLTRQALLNILDERATVDELVSSRPYTFIRIHSWFNKEEYVGMGFSKVCYPDKWDAEQGADIAKRKACISILHQIRRREDLASIYVSE